MNDEIQGPGDDRDDGEPSQAGERPGEFTAAERRDIEADLEDLAAMHASFHPQGVKGVIIACRDCGSNHYFEWDLLRENLEHMLETGELRMHEPAFGVAEEDYIQWDYGKGYIDALAEVGLEPDRMLQVTRCPWCETPFGDDFAFCPRCGRSLGAIRLYRELIDRGVEEREARAMLVRAGYEPF